MTALSEILRLEELDRQDEIRDHLREIVNDLPKYMVSYSRSNGPYEHQSHYGTWVKKEDVQSLVKKIMDVFVDEGYLAL